VPAYERTLCPDEPLGQRLEPTEYGWHSPDPSAGLDPPRGITPNEAMDDFARRAIKAQPVDYARTVLRDLASNFFVPRLDYFEYDTAWKWEFDHYVHWKTTDYTRPAYLQHGGDLPTTRQPFASALAYYGFAVYLWGPLLLLLTLLGLAGLVRGRGPGRPLVAALLLTGIGLMAAPDVTAEFVWRYQLPAVLLVPLAAALAWTRLRAPATSPAPEERTVNRQRIRTLVSFGASSVIATVCSEVVLILCYGVLGISPSIASVIAWFAGAVPNFFVNRAWTWQRRGRPSLRGELLPYAGIVLVTLLIAMLATHGVARATADAEHSVRTALVAITYFGVYVLMFLVRFVLFQRLYGRSHSPSGSHSEASA
jgi:putative flippase GtrA